MVTSKATQKSKIIKCNSVKYFLVSLHSTQSSIFSD